MGQNCFGRSLTGSSSLNGRLIFVLVRIGIVGKGDITSAVGGRMSSQDEEELKVYLRGTKFEPTLDRLVKRAENSDARMRNGLSKDDKQRMLEKLQSLKEELEYLKLWAAADHVGVAIDLVHRRKSY